jgi:hypothetical protein
MEHEHVLLPVPFAVVTAAGRVSEFKFEKERRESFGSRSVGRESSNEDFEEVRVWAWARVPLEEVQGPDLGREARPVSR